MEFTSLFAQLRASRSQRGAWTRSGQRDTSLNNPVAPTLQTQQAWSVSKKYTLASTARHPQGS
jgi:hypothetical protein